jgi:hypothetical protein
LRSFGDFDLIFGSAKLNENRQTIRYMPGIRTDEYLDQARLASAENGHVAMNKVKFV